MTSKKWDAVVVKAQLRQTSQRLGQLQDQKDVQASTIRRDIAKLLNEGNIGIARAKAQTLIHEDAIGDLLEMLGMYIGVLIEHFNELDQSSSPTALLAEAASTIIYAGPHVDSEDLSAIRDILMNRMGPDFSQSATENRDHRVPIRVMNATTAPALSASQLDGYLLNIAKMFSVKWTPEPQRQEIVATLRDMLDPNTVPIIDLPLLQKLCSRGIPDEPAWLRPQIWKIYFGILPVLKRSWVSSLQKQRDSYYELVQRLLEPFTSLPTPTTPLHSLDAALNAVNHELSRLPSSLVQGVNDVLSPGMQALHDKMPFFNVLDERIAAIKEMQSQDSDVPQIHLEEPGSPESEHGPIAGRRKKVPKPLIVGSSQPVHETHYSALLRLLYLHSVMNPGSSSPQLPCLLVPLYAVLCQQIDPVETAHIEADTFWLFEAMLGEFSELEDEEEGTIWMKKFGDRVGWADPELRDGLASKGLDPALPHYSYRWLAPVLTHTLPFRSVIVAWDALFSCPMRERNLSPKLERLLDICAAMLIRARAVLLRLGKSGRMSPSLWSDEYTKFPPPSPARAWELGDAFSEGMALLQNYPLEAAGGIDRLLQTATDLAYRRHEERKLARAEPKTFGARIGAAMWKGFTNQDITPEGSDSESSEEEEEEHSSESSPNGYDTESPTHKPQAGSNITSRLATSIWRGITNQSVMDEPPSPASPVHPELRETTDSRNMGMGWRQYAEKLKDSDTAAALSRASTNWRARASNWAVRQSTPMRTSSTDTISAARRSAPIEEAEKWNLLDGRRGSVPDIARTAPYSPPPMPNSFRPPRDSTIIDARRLSLSSFSGLSSPELSPPSNGSLLSKTVSIQASLAALTGSPQPRTGPKPLLLNSSSLMTGHSRPLSISRDPNATPGRSYLGDHEPQAFGYHRPDLSMPVQAPPSRSPNSTPGPNHRTSVPESEHALGHHRDSQSSVSSLSPFDALNRHSRTSSRTSWESESAGSSRKVPLNRRSISPMALGSRIQSVRPESLSSHASSDAGLLSPPPIADTHETKGKEALGWDSISVESPTLSSPPRPQTPISLPASEPILVKEQESQSHELLPQHINSAIQRQGDADIEKKAGSIVRNSSRSPQFRSKRYQTLNRDSTSPDDATLVSPRSSPKSEASSADPDAPKERRPQRQATRHSTTTRDSIAIEGDDEGYDDLLSAYGSEEE